MSRRFQFSLATIFWLTFLLPAAYFVTYGFRLKKAGYLFALVAASLALKVIIEKIGKKPKSHQSQDVHPLDE